jgi:accessory gene regulator protein AgrB
MRYNGARRVFYIMEIDINYITVLLATIASLVVSSFWYSPAFLYKPWLKLNGITDKQFKATFKRAMIIAIITTLIKAYVLFHFIIAAHATFNNSWLGDSLMTGFWAWLGLSGATLLSTDAYAGKNIRASIIELSHQLVTILTIALVIGLLK